jgi:hypothetical protein
MADAVVGAVSDAAGNAVPLQFWGEATVNPDLHDVLTGQLDAMRTAMEHALQRWAHQQVDGVKNSLLGSPRPASSCAKDFSPTAACSAG